MKFLLNLLWFVFGGLLACIFWCVAGLTLCLTVVGIPFGLQAIKMGVASLAPFGKKIESGKNANGPIRIILTFCGPSCLDGSWRCTTCSGRCSGR